nr:hypothetical protein [Rahnella woolbedingensis]
MTTLPLNFQSLHLTITGRSGKSFTNLLTKKQAFLNAGCRQFMISGIIPLKRDEGGDRTYAQIKIPSLIAIAVERKQVKANANEQEKDKRDDPPDIENRFFQFDGRSLLV